MIQNMIADYQTNGSNTAKILLLGNSVLFQVKACGTMTKEEVIGDQYLFMAMIQIVTFTLEHGMMIKTDTAS